MIRTADDKIRLYVNPKNAVYCHKGLSTVQLKQGSTYQEDQTNQYQHIATAIGYFIDWMWPLGSIKINSQVTTGHY